MFDSHPKIQLTKTKNERYLELASYVLIAFQIIYISSNYSSLPETVPTHLDLNGKVNRFDDKSFIWTMPILGFAVTFVLFWLNKFPHWFNYIHKVTEDNAEKTYRYTSNFIRLLVLAINILCVVISYNIVNMSINNEVEFGTTSKLLMYGCFLFLTIAPIVYIFKEGYKLFRK